ncbi:MAG: tetratricopeptide repeat protein, partial [Myxococcota bacterium]
RIEGLMHLHRSERKAGIARLQQAIARAIAHRHDELALDAWLALSEKASIDADRPDLADLWIAQTKAFLARIAPSSDLRHLRLKRAEALVAIANARFARARDVAAAALDRAAPDRPETWSLRMVLASAHLSLGQAQPALAEYTALLPRFTERWGPNHPTVGVIHINLGHIYVQYLGDPDRAQRHFDQALQIFEGAYGQDSLRVAEVHAAQSIVDQHAGDYAAALAHLEKSLKIENRRLGPTHSRTANTWMNIGVCQHLLSNYAEATKSYSRALSIFRDKLSPDHDAVATASSNLAESLVALHKHEQARPLFEDALRIMKMQLGDQHPDLAYPLKGLGLIGLATGSPQSAIRRFERALVLSPAATADPQERAEISWGLARSLRRADRTPRRASALAREALSIYQRLGPTWRERTQTIQKWLAHR